MSTHYDKSYEESLWNDIFGCVNYLKLPYDTVMEMPVHIRKYWIKKHNQKVKEEENNLKQLEGNNGSSSVSSVGINAYARHTQNEKNN